MLDDRIFGGIRGIRLHAWKILFNLLIVYFNDMVSTHVVYGGRGYLRNIPTLTRTRSAMSTICRVAGKLIMLLIISKVDHFQSCLLDCVSHVFHNHVEWLITLS